MKRTLKRLLSQCIVLSMLSSVMLIAPLCGGAVDVALDDAKWTLSHKSDFTVASDKLGSDISTLSYNGWSPATATQAGSYAQIVADPQDSSNHVLKNVTPYDVEGVRLPFINVKKDNVALSGKIKASMRVNIATNYSTSFCIELQDTDGKRIVRLRLREPKQSNQWTKKNIYATSSTSDTAVSLGTYPAADTWFKLDFVVDTASRTLDVYLDGTKLNTSSVPFYFGDSTSSDSSNIGYLSFKSWKNITGTEFGDAAESDDIAYIDDVEIYTYEEEAQEDDTPVDESAYPYVGGNFKEAWDVAHYSDFTVTDSMLGKCVCQTHGKYLKWDRIDRTFYSLNTNIINEPQNDTNCIMEITRTAYTGSATQKEEAAYAVARDTSNNAVGLSGIVDTGMRLKEKTASDVNFTVALRDSQAPASQYWVNGKYIALLLFKDGKITAKSSNTQSTEIGTYPRNKWFHLEIKAHTTAKTYDVYVDGVKISSVSADFYNSTHNSTVAVVEYNIERSGTTGTWYVDDVALWKDRSADLEAAKNNLTDEVISTESLDSITKNLNLLQEMNGYKIAWESSVPDVITNNGTVTARSEETAVTLTATITSDANDACLQKAKAQKVFNVTVGVARELPEVTIQPSVKDANFAETWEVHHYSSFTVDNSSIGSTVYGYNNWDRINRSNLTYTSNFIMDPDKMNNYLLELNRFNSSTGNERPYLTVKNGDGEIKGLTDKVNIGMRLKVKEASDAPFTVVVRDSGVVNYYTNGNYMMYLSFNANGTLASRISNRATSLGNYPTDNWFELVIEADTVSRTYDVYIDGTKVNTAPLAFYYADTGSDNGNISVVELDIQKEGTKGTWYVDDVTVWKERKPELNAVADTLTPEDISQEALTNVTANLTLPQTVEGYTTRWISDNTAAVGEDGTVTQGSYTQNATVTAQILYSDDSSLVQNAQMSKSFALQIPPASGVTAAQTLAAVADEWLSDERISYEPLTEITKHLRILPTQGPDGITISWHSDKTDFVTHDGLVTRPAVGQEDETVTLTATLSKDGAENAVKPFTLTVLALPTASEVLDAAAAALSLSMITYEKASSIRNKLYFIDNLEGASITWSSDRPDIIASDGTVNRGDSNIPVVLTATLSYNGETRPVTFNLTVLKNPNKTMQEDLEGIVMPTTLISDYNLDKLGKVNMSSITWTSSNANVIRISNYVAYVTRPEFTDGDKSVTLTAKIALEGMTQSRSFTVTVTKLPSDETLVNDVYNLLTYSYISIEDPAAITRNLALQTEFDGGVTVEWTSSDEGVIAGDGSVTNPGVGGSDATVTLTARIYKRDAQLTNTFTFTVKPFASEQEIVERAAEELTFSTISTEPIGAVTLPLNLVTDWKFGTSVSWSAAEGYLSVAEDSDGNAVALVNPPAYGSGAQTSTLTATISYGAQSKTKTFIITVSEEKSYTEIYNHTSETLEIGADPKQGSGSFTKFPMNTQAKVYTDPAGSSGKVIRFIKPAGNTSVSGTDELIYYAPSQYEGKLVVGGKFYMPDDISEEGNPDDEQFLDTYFFYEVMGSGGVQLPIRFCKNRTVQAGINEAGISKYLTTSGTVFDYNTWVDFRFEVDANTRRYHIYINDVCVSADGSMTYNGESYSTWLGIPYVKFETSSSKNLTAYRLSMAAGKHEKDSVFYLDDMYMLQQNTTPDALQSAIDTFEREFLSANNLEAVTGNLTIPVIPSNIVTYSYYSDNTATVNTKGEVTRPAADETVTFSVEAVLGNETLRRDYTLTVKAVEPAEAAQKDLDAAISAIKAAHNLGAVTSNISINSPGEMGSTVKIVHSSNESAVSLQGVISRGSTDQTVTLTIEAVSGGVPCRETITVTVKQQAAASTTTSYEASSTVPTVSGYSSNAGGGGSAGIQIKPVEKPIMSFNDLSASHWAYEAIEALWEEGIVKGVSENSFEPERSVTREEFAKLLACVTDISPKNKDVAFLDVPEARWSYQYIRTLATNGIIYGQAEGYFGADANVSRQDMAVMIYRALKSMGIALEAVRSTPLFSDAAQISPYAQEAVSALYSYGIINGISEWEFCPTANATRAQAAQILYTLMQKIN